jgi:hypothetical protein
MGEQRTAIAWPQPPDDYAAFQDGIPPGFSPPVPPVDSITVFGETQELNPVLQPLSEQDCPTLYDENSPALIEIRKLNRRLLFTFQKLVGTIAEGNQNPEEPLRHLIHLFKNAHFLLHTLRPIQALEHIRFFLHEQNLEVDRFREEFEAKLAAAAALRPP